MEKTLIRQNAQWNGKMFDHLCPRDIMDNLLKKKTMRHVQILTGVRRCGKSTVFKLLINDLLQSGVSGKSILVLNLDDPQFIPFWDDSSKLFGVIENAERLTGEKVKYLFLDEVQHLCDWEIFIKSAYDTEIFEKIYITGSVFILHRMKYTRQAYPVDCRAYRSIMVCTIFSMAIRYMIIPAAV